MRWTDSGTAGQAPPWVARAATVGHPFAGIQYRAHWHVSGRPKKRAVAHRPGAHAKLLARQRQAQSGRRRRHSRHGQTRPSRFCPCRELKLGHRLRAMYMLPSLRAVAHLGQIGRTRRAGLPPGRQYMIGRKYGLQAGIRYRSGAPSGYQNQTSPTGFLPVPVAVLAAFGGNDPRGCRGATAELTPDEADRAGQLLKRIVPADPAIAGGDPAAPRYGPKNFARIGEVSPRLGAPVS